MSWRKALLFLMGAAIFLPATANANSLQFTFDKGRVSVTFKPGSFLSNEVKNAGATTAPKLSTLIGASSVPAGPSFTGSNLGTVGFTTGSLTGTTLSGGNIVAATFAPGGDINVVAGSGAFPGITGGTSLFSGVFSSVQNFTWNCTNPVLLTCAPTPKNGGTWTLSGAVTTNTLNSTLLALLGLPNLSSGHFTSLQIDVSFKLQGGVVKSGTITLVPEPGTLALFGTGLMGLAGLVRRRLK